MTAVNGKTLRLRIFSAGRRLSPWIAIGCVSIALWPRAGELRLCLGRMNAGYLVLAMTLCLAYWFLNAGVWSWILESLGHSIPFLAAVRIWLTSESLRWLPGTIWGFCSRITAAKGIGIPVGTASISLPLELSMTVLAWGAVALVGLALSGLGVRFLGSYANWLGPLFGAGLFALAGLKLGWPVLRRQSWFRSGLERLQMLLCLHLKRRALVRSGLAYLALNTVHGLGFWLILSGMGYQGTVSVAAAIGANAAGWLLGFFAIGVPGGIGVREAGAAIVLSPIMPWQEAALAAALWRVLQIVAELLSLLPWLFTGGKKKEVPATLAEESSR
jgi:glycosyltransferase 2 family protein